LGFIRQESSTALIKVINDFRERHQRYSLISKKPVTSSNHKTNAKLKNQELYSTQAGWNSIRFD